ncbi:MAG: hypothetical protein M1834_006201 [Cirrosporium novae-zelandiae]|nr:MAG: hypothetical protein M1834_006201 [Cirrosporium novae-zelandiae]
MPVNRRRGYPMPHESQETTSNVPSESSSDPNLLNDPTPLDIAHAHAIRALRIAHQDATYSSLTLYRIMNNLTSPPAHEPFSPMLPVEIQEMITQHLGLLHKIAWKYTCRANYRGTQVDRKMRIELQRWVVTGWKFQGMREAWIEEGGLARWIGEMMYWEGV